MSPDDARGADAPPHHDLVVIGASAGGVQVLLDLAAGLPSDFPACVLVVLHVGAHRSLLPELMNARGPLQAAHPQDGQALVPGRIFIAPPDHHLLVRDGRMRLTRGPKENHARPAIDPLFRTAALDRGSRVIGVILSGRLDDGTAGLQAIKRCGGLAVVQDPADAEQPEMPGSAVAHVEVDACVPGAQLAATLAALTAAPGSATAAPQDPEIAIDQAISIGAGDPMENLNAIGHPSHFACPECAGVLWELDDTQPRRNRCHTGHGYTVRSVADTQGEATDEALWGAMRALQEREALLNALADDAASAGAEGQTQDLRARAGRSGQHAQQLRDIIDAD
jgi:two-component system chemotaxis response regulator CheB